MVFDFCCCKAWGYLEPIHIHMDVHSGISDYAKQQNSNDMYGTSNISHGGAKEGEEKTLIEKRKNSTNSISSSAVVAAGSKVDLANGPAPTVTDLAQLENQDPIPSGKKTKKEKIAEKIKREEQERAGFD